MHRDGPGPVPFQGVPRSPGNLLSVCATDVEPHVGEHGILEDPRSYMNQRLYCAVAWPCLRSTHGFSLVLRDTPAGGVHGPEEDLRAGVALLSSQAEPPEGFGGVLGDAPPLAVHVPEVDLRIGIALLGLAAEFRNRVRSPARAPKARLASTPARKEQVVCLLAAVSFQPPIRGCGRVPGSRPAPASAGGHYRRPVLIRTRSGRRRSKRKSLGEGCVDATRG